MAHDTFRIDLFGQRHLHQNAVDLWVPRQRRDLLDEMLSRNVFWRRKFNAANSEFVAGS